MGVIPSSNPHSGGDNDAMKHVLDSIVIQCYNKPYGDSEVKMETQAPSDKMVSIRITTDEYARLEELSRLMGTSKTGVIRFFLARAVVTTAVKPAVVEIIKPPEAKRD